MATPEGFVSSAVITICRSCSFSSVLVIILIMLCSILCEGACDGREREREHLCLVDLDPEVLVHTEPLWGPRPNAFHSRSRTHGWNYAFCLLLCFIQRLNLILVTWIIWLKKILFLCLNLLFYLFRDSCVWFSVNFMVVNIHGFLWRKTRQKMTSICKCRIWDEVSFGGGNPSAEGTFKIVCVLQKHERKDQHFFFSFLETWGNLLEIPNFCPY